MPTLDEVIDNLGEPMDFTERRADDDVYEEGWDGEDSGVRIDNADEQIEFRNLDMAGQPGATRPDIDVEAAGPSGGDGGSGSSDRRGGSDGESNSNNGGRTHVDKLNVKGKVLDKKLELGEVRSKS